jgi:translation initiation factor 2 subunit 1
MATVKKVLPYGAIVSLDEFDGSEGFVHISQLSKGWTKNVSEYLKQNQKAVLKVIRIDEEKRQIDLSLKRVSEGERRVKADSFKSEKRALKLLERAAIQSKSTFAKALKEAGEPLAEEYGDLYSAFEALSLGEKPKSKVTKKWLDALTAVAVKEIKHKDVEIGAVLNLVFYGGDGLGRLKKALAAMEKASGLKAHYVSAGKYSIKSVAPDYKAAEAALAKANQAVEKAVKADSDFEYSFVKEGKK